MARKSTEAAPPTGAEVVEGGHGSDTVPNFPLFDDAKELTILDTHDADADAGIMPESVICTDLPGTELYLVTNQNTRGASFVTLRGVRCTPGMQALVDGDEVEKLKALKLIRLPVTFHGFE